MRTRSHLLALLLCPVLALATTIVPHTLADRARDSDRVVLVQVLSRRTSVDPADPRKMKTLTEVVVGQDVRGKGPERLTVVQLGGRNGGWEQKVPGDATFSVGETAVLFLKCIAPERCALVAFGAGKIQVAGGDALYQDLFSGKWVRRPLPDLIAELQKVPSGGVK
jgi:hypothetical protein